MRGVAVTGMSLGIAATMLVTASPVSADSPRLPTLHVKGYGATQAPVAETGVYEYPPTSGTRCSVLIADGGGEPKPFLVEPGTQHVRIRLHTTTQPKQAKVRSRITFTGETSKVASHLVRRKDHRGKKSWVVTFALDVPRGQDVYPELTVAYDKGKRCTTRTDSYGYHLRGATG